MVTKIVFQSTLPIQGETIHIHSGDRYVLFQSTLPIQGETSGIEALDVVQTKFQSTLPIQGETLSAMKIGMEMAFQSTLPIQGETNVLVDVTPEMEISIHSPYTGRDDSGRAVKGSLEHFNPLSLYRERRGTQEEIMYAKNISIHSPYTGRDGLLPRSLET